MTIPDEAVEAGQAEVERMFSGDLVGGASDTLVRVILEAAAPHMLALQRGLLTPCHGASISAVKDHNDDVEIYCSHDRCANLWDFDGDVIYMEGSQA